MRLPVLNLLKEQTGPWCQIKEILSNTGTENEPRTGTKKNLEVLALLTEQIALHGLSLTLSEEKRKGKENAASMLGNRLLTVEAAALCEPPARGPGTVQRADSFVEAFPPRLLALEEDGEAPCMAPAHWVWRR